MALIAVLIWGALSFVSLPQQEDPALPPRIARVICMWPGAPAAKVEELVTEQLEKRIAGLETIEEMSSESRAGVAIIIRAAPGSDGEVLCALGRIARRGAGPRATARSRSCGKAATRWAA